MQGRERGDEMKALVATPDQCEGHRVRCIKPPEISPISRAHLAHISPISARCEGHFIRCIKPNGVRQAFEFDER